jgi:hypothetical protein
MEDWIAGAIKSAKNYIQKNAAVAKDAQIPSEFTLLTSLGPNELRRNNDVHPVNQYTEMRVSRRVEPMSRVVLR